ncbi:MAG: tetratricopeptide repeat protein [Deltaproteobacteria bacterium]|nr:tetratricopeptide repeat protein [Deltaproteobacteria bacterium]
MSLLPAPATAQRRRPGEAANPVLDALRTAARQNRRDAGAQSAYGLALLRAGKLTEAQRALQAASRLDRDNATRVFDVTRVASARGEFRPARAACRTLSRFETSPLGHVCLARAYLVWNRSARAFEELEAATAMAPEDFEAQLALGDAHRIRAAVAEAEAAYQRASRARPNSALPYLGLGLLYTAAHRNGDAAAALRTADGKTELESGSPRGATGHPEVAYALGRVLEGAEAIAAFRTAVAGRTGWADAEVALGDALLASGDAAAARASYEAATRATRNSAAAYVGLGRALTATGDHEAAMVALDRAIEIVDNHPRAVLARAQLLEAMGQNEPAFQAYRQAADLMTGNPEPMLSAAALALRLRRDVLAVGFLDRVLMQQENLARALELYGDAMVARSDSTSARRYYERALNGTGPFDRGAVQRKLRGLR